MATGLAEAQPEQAGSGSRDQQGPSAGSLRSAAWVRARHADGVAAARRRVAPRSSDIRAEATARSVVTVADSGESVVRHSSCATYPAGAARHCTGGTTAAGGRVRSTACRSGNTPGSPDQGKPGSGSRSGAAGPCRRRPPCLSRTSSGLPHLRRSYRPKGRRLSTVSTASSTAGWNQPTALSVQSGSTGKSRCG